MSAKLRKYISRIVSLTLIITLIVSIASPVFAAANNNMAKGRFSENSPTQQKILNRAIANPVFTNISELTTSEKEMVTKVTKKPNIYLLAADVFEDQIVLIYETPDSDMMIASTDGHIEVVYRKDENTFIINGEEHYFEVTEEMGITPLRWWEVPDPGVTWTYIGNRWINVHAENAFRTYTIGILATIIAFFLNPYAGAATAVASMILASQYTNTSVARIHRYEWRASNQWVEWRRVLDYCYAVWQGSNVYLGLEVRFYARVPGF